MRETLNGRESKRNVLGESQNWLQANPINLLEIKITVTKCINFDIYNCIFFFFFSTFPVLYISYFFHCSVSKIVLPYFSTFLHSYISIILLVNLKYFYYLPWKINLVTKLFINIYIYFLRQKFIVFFFFFFSILTSLYFPCFIFTNSALWAKLV